MSATLMMRPAYKGTDLPDALKFAIRKSDWFQGNTLVTVASLPYFEGLRDAGVEGAQEVLDAFEKHGELELFLTQ